MLEPLLGEVVLFPYFFAPEGWAWCDGQARRVSEDSALYSLLEHRFGGSEREEVFKLPNYDEHAPEGLRYAIATAGYYPTPDLSSRDRFVGEVAIFAFAPRELGSGPWKSRAASPALPGATFVVAKSGKPEPALYDNILGEVRLLEVTTAPPHWMRCDGQKLRITEHQALYALFGPKFGGDGIRDFALPDLRSREPAGARYFIAFQGAFPRRP